MREHGGDDSGGDVDAVGHTGHVQKDGDDGARGSESLGATTSIGKAKATVSVRSPVKASRARARGASTSARGDLAGEELASARAGSAEVSSADEYVLEFDGASRGNPGEAGAGALLRRKRDDRVVEELLEYLGSERTVNEAEYAALCLGLRKAIELGITKIEVRGDSKLIVNQVDGSFKLKSENLRSMHAEAVSLKKKFAEFKISHVKREFNKHADHLANMAVDFGLSPSRMTGDSSGFESGGGGLGGDDAKRRKTSGEARCGSKIFHYFPTATGSRGYSALSRAEHSGDEKTVGLAAMPAVFGSASRSYWPSSSASARRSFIGLTRAAMSLARLRL